MRFREDFVVGRPLVQGDSGAKVYPEGGVVYFASASSSIELAVVCCAAIAPACAEVAAE